MVSMLSSSVVDRGFLIGSKIISLLFVASPLSLHLKIDFMKLYDKKDDFKLASFSAASPIKELMIGATSSGISDHLRYIYSICRCCWNVATYKWKIHKGNLKSSFLS
jgi:hypothetical protein